MMSLRKWLTTAVMTLALAVPMMTASPVKANSPAPVNGQTRIYYVYAREDPSEPWTCIASFDNYNDAQTTAAYLHDLGFDAFVR